MQEDMNFSEMSLDELQDAQTRALVHMHQAITAKKTEGDPTPQIEKTAEVLHNSGLIDDGEHAKLMGKPAQDLNEESLVRALIDVRQIKGDVEPVMGGDE